MSPPRVSVIMPVYNARTYLREAGESILSQSLKDFELIAVDDGSTDGSGEILDEMAARDPRVRVVHQPNSGIVEALNRAIDLAAAPYIARMDADDIALPQRLAAQAAFLDQHRDVVAVGTRVLSITEQGWPIATQFLLSEHEKIDHSNLTGSCALAHPTVMMRADAVRSVGGYRDTYKLVEDVDLWLRLAEKGKLANLPQVLFKYRVRMGSLEQSRSGSQKRAEAEAAMFAEARQRRGLEPGRPHHAIPRPGTASAFHGNFARLALIAGNYATAFRLGWMGLRDNFSTGRNWLTVGLAALGPIGRGMLVGWYRATGTKVPDDPD